MTARMSRLLAPTLREAPTDAELPSHRLMLRAGLMRRVGESAGLYALLPLGLRVKAKVEAIIRNELDALGAQEVVLPIVQPAELWEETGRWAVYGDEMWRLQDRHGRRYCLAPTHEEVITDLARHELRSWRQLPMLLYQIQNKYRDERRPRFGLLRAREFVMKDAYSFHADAADLERCYAAMYGAYARIFSRCGLDCRAVLADPGAIGGSRTHEFMALADSGEAEIAHCVGCDYAADVEEAECGPEAPAPGSGARPAAAGPGGVTEAAARHGVPAAGIARTLWYRAALADGRVQTVAVVLPGDRLLNEARLLRATAAVGLRPAETGEVPPGEPGAVGLPADVSVFTDGRVARGGPWLIGGPGATHLRDALAGRDFDPGTVAELSQVRAGDACPRCGEALRTRRGIEVGQVFGLGTKYSSSLGATFLDASGQERPLVMGCYGIGVTRTIAAVVEQCHDEDGIRWPVAVAPYHCVVIPVGGGAEGERALDFARGLCQDLEGHGLETLLDDRDVRPGVKFKDADLIGLPLRITVGRSLADGAVEFRLRAGAEVGLVPVAAAAAKAAELLGTAPHGRPHATDVGPGEGAVRGASPPAPV